MGPGSILQERRHSQLEDITAENGAWPHLFSKLRSPLGLDFVIILGNGLFFVMWTSPAGKV